MRVYVVIPKLYMYFSFTVSHIMKTYLLSVPLTAMAMKADWRLVTSNSVVITITIPITIMVAVLMLSLLIAVRSVIFVNRSMNSTIHVRSQKLS